MARQKQKENLAEQLEQSFSLWERLRDYGGSDPFYTDGVNMNLVRNHIIYYKQALTGSMNEVDLPEIYHRPTPPETPMDYVARADEIRAAARTSLEIYKVNPHYKYLVSHAPALMGKQIKDTCANAVIGYVTGLERAIAEDDLVTMRRHEDSSRYICSFEPCAARVKEALNQPQQNLFAMLLDDEAEADEEMPDDDNALIM